MKMQSRMKSRRDNMELRQRACSGLCSGRFLLVLGLVSLISSLFSLNADAQLRRLRDEIHPQPKPEVLLLQKQWNVVRWYEPTVLHDQERKRHEARGSAQRLFSGLRD